MLIFPGGRGGGRGWLITGIIKALLNKDKLIDVLIKIRYARRGLIIACIFLFTSRWACGLDGRGLISGSLQ